LRGRGVADTGTVQQNPEPRLSTRARLHYRYLTTFTRLFA
jgi:hypothetical protein